FELEKRLVEWGKEEYVQQVRAIADLANFHYIRQKGPYGNGTPIWNARSFIGDDPFLYVWADDFITASPTRSQQLVAAYESSTASAILGGIRKSGPEDYKRYAYVIGRTQPDGAVEVETMIEKPGKGVIDSDLAIVSGFVFGPEIVGAVGQAMRQLAEENSGRELYYTDAVNLLMAEGKRVVATEIAGARYYDCGNKLEYLKAVVEFGLAHDDLRDDFGKFLKGVVE
ncbi:MAG: UTP--glucose-1-phosphate uridylyltransferase, partial [Candidatus Doudnabacteria bacterium]|nr:UTP--glucose-1-phosphate uridylyltransferase [Candidatus Doudnabacteria bacterium]